MKRFGILNVIDLERTCYEGDKFPAGEQSEIIEIGLCSVDLRTLRIIKSASLPVIPTRSSVSAYCTELTGWTMAELQRKGMPFAEACRRLGAKHGTGSRLLVTDAIGDVLQIQSQCAQMSVESPIGCHHLNVSTMFTLLTNQTRRLNLEAMLAFFNMKFEGRLHRAVDDAKNIARLLIKLLELGRSAMPASSLPTPLQ